MTKEQKDTSTKDEAISQRLISGTEVPYSHGTVFARVDINIIKEEVNVLELQSPRNHQRFKRMLRNGYKKQDIIDALKKLVIMRRMELDPYAVPKRYSGLIKYRTWETPLPHLSDYLRANPDSLFVIRDGQYTRPVRYTRMIDDKKGIVGFEYMSYDGKYAYEEGQVGP